MAHDSSSSRNSPRGPNWLLRRADQPTVAVLALAALVSTVGWWMSEGGLHGRLIEVDRAMPRVARFQVDLNRAQWPELVQLPRIGPTLARRIVESRETNGPFASHDDLKRVRGIGPKTLEAIRPYLRPIRTRAKKGTGPICRDGPEGASHKLELSPMSLP